MCVCTCCPRSTFVDPAAQRRRHIERILWESPGPRPLPLPRHSPRAAFTPSIYSTPPQNKKKTKHTHSHILKSIASLFLSASFPQFFTLYTVYTTYLLLASIDLSPGITCMRDGQVVCDCQHPALICPSVGDCVFLSPATSQPSIGSRSGIHDARAIAV